MDPSPWVVHSVKLAPPLLHREDLTAGSHLRLRNSPDVATSSTSMALRCPPARPTASPTMDSSSHHCLSQCARASPSLGASGLYVIQPTPPRAPHEHQDPHRPLLHHRRPMVHAPATDSPLPTHAVMRSHVPMCPFPP
jgi:hypothetical protein